MIPNRIFTFWVGEPNRIVSACHSKMREKHPGWEITMIESTDHEDIERIEGFDSLSIQAKSDWARLCLVAKYGGVWLDATALCVRPVTEWVDMASDKVIGFGCPITGCESVLENWAFAARANHPLIRKWKDEFKKAIAMGVDAYKKHYINIMGNHPISNHMPYLTMHGAYTVVQDPKQVHMVHACDKRMGPFSFLCSPHWPNGMFAALGMFHGVSRLFRKNIDLPPLVKFTGDGRRIATIHHICFPTLRNSSAAIHMGLEPAWGLVVPITCALSVLLLVFLIYIYTLKTAT
jgi:hypothetical protein